MQEEESAYQNQIIENKPVWIPLWALILDGSYHAFICSGGCIVEPQTGQVWPFEIKEEAK